MSHSLIIHPSSIKKMTQQISLSIKGMTCGHCAATVERNAKSVAGVTEAVVNLAAAKAQISYDPAQTDLAAIITQIEKSGYQVSKETLDVPNTSMACGCGSCHQPSLSSELVLS